MPKRDPAGYTKVHGIQNYFYGILNCREKRQTLTPCSLKSTVYDYASAFFNTQLLLTKADYHCT